MERRDVLKAGAVATLAGSGCAPLLSNPGAVGEQHMDDFLAQLDGGLDAIAKKDFFGGLVDTSNRPELAERVKAGEALAKKTMQSLFLVGTLQELPPERVAHEGVQQRLRASMGLFDDAMFGMNSMLEGLSPSERANISKALRDDPGLGMKVMGSVDEQAAAMGVSMAQRTKLRSVSAHTCARLRQSPELTINEFTGKMRKLEARSGARAQAERELAAAIGASLLWQQDPTAPAAGGTVAPPPPAAPAEPTPPPPPPPIDVGPPPADGLSGPGTGTPQPQPQKPLEPKKAKAAPVVLTGGAIALGLGATLLGIGFISGSSGFLLVAATFGAIFGILGLITLIVGLILLAAGV